MVRRTECNAIAYFCALPHCYRKTAFRDMPLLKSLFFALLAYAVCSCATWEQRGILAKNEKLSIAVQDVAITAKVETITDVMSSPPKTGDEQALVQQQLNKVSVELTRFLHASISQSTNLELVQQQKSLNSNAQAILSVEISGYGKLKRKWLALLLASGAMEGIVQGVAAAALVNTTWVGVAVALEEFGQEMFVWGGGAFLFNRYYAPVTLEATLMSAKDQKIIWRKTIFVNVDRKGIKALAEQDRGKKELQLLLTAQKAIDELVVDLDTVVEQKLYPHNDGPDCYDWGM